MDFNKWNLFFKLFSWCCIKTAISY